MIKLFAKNLILGWICALASMAVASAVLALLGLIAQILNFPFSPIPILIIGGIVGFICGMMLGGGIFFRRKSYFLPEDLNLDNDLWINYIKTKKYIKKWAAYSSFIPHFVFSAVSIALIAVFYDEIINFSGSSYIGACVLCGLESSSVISWLVIGIFGIRSFAICVNCGAVNTLIYQSDEEFASASGFTGESYNFNYAVHHGMSQGGGGYDTKKLSKYGNRVRCKCACCENESSYTEIL